ncbi:MAG: butyrate kinase [Kosmotogaceae bacterium]|nr:butyrate kinase [Kosmotogaceae bacterium]
MKILAINPGSTSTKIAVFDDEHEVTKGAIRHFISQKNPEDDIQERAEEIISFLRDRDVQLDFDAIACRGGILPPLESGTYRVNEKMVDFLLHHTEVDHPSNLAAPIGLLLSKGKIPVFITDPISIDEFCEEARLSGLPQLPRISRLHALNMKAAARQIAADLGKNVENLNLVIAHLGGGISVGLQLRGKMVDVNNATDEGPFSPTRTGELPVGDLSEKCFSGEYTEKQLIDRYLKSGGLRAYLGTDDLRKALEMADSDPDAAMVVDAMIYQISKEIGGMVALGGGKIDAIVLTGGMAYNAELVEKIKSFVGKFALVVIEPGENELLSLALGAQRVLEGTEKAREFDAEVAS